MLWIFLLMHITQGLYFQLENEVEKCFIEDLPQSTTVVGTYEVLETTLQQPDGVHITVYDSKGKEIYTRFTTKDGKLTFTSQKSGVYKVCVKAVASKWFSNRDRGLRFSLRLEPTTEMRDSKDLAQQEHLSTIQQLTQAVTTRIQEITKEQEYAIEKETKFMDESEDIHSRIMWFTIFQTLVILLSGIWQLLSLRSFFIAKKIF